MKEKTKKPFYKRWWFVGFIGLLVLGIIMGLLEPEEVKQERLAEEAAIEQKKDDDKAARKAEAERVIKEADEAERAIENLPIDQRLTKKDNFVDRAEFTEPGFLEVIHVTQTADKDTIAMEDVYGVFGDFKEAFDSPEVTGVKATIVNEGKNAEGEHVVENMVILVYSKETFENLDFDSFLKTSKGEEWRIYNESDEYYLYPAIFRNVDESFLDNLTSGVSKVPPITD